MDYFVNAYDSTSKIPFIDPESCYFINTHGRGRHCDFWYDINNIFLDIFIVL